MKWQTNDHNFTSLSIYSSYQGYDLLCARIKQDGSSSDFEEGMMRYNNEDDRVEIFDGTNWVSVAGSSGGISRNDAEAIALEYVLILG